MTVTGLGLSAKGVLDSLKDSGFTHVIGLPDSEANFMYAALAEDRDLKLIQVCREGEAIPIAVGLTITGHRPVCLIQSTGLMESGDSVRGMGIDVKLPLLLMIGYRGWRGGQPMTDSAAIYLEPILDAWKIPHYLLETDADLGRVAEAWQDAQQRSGPVAVLVGREYK